MKIRVCLVFLLVTMLFLCSCGVANGPTREVPLTPLPKEGEGMNNGQTNPDRPREKALFGVGNDNVKPIGRTVMIDGVRWCGFSGSGMEFFFAGRSLSIRLVADQMASDEIHRARVGIFVDGKCMRDVLMDEPYKTVSVIDQEEDTIAIVRVVKLSEVSDSTVGIESVEADGAITPLQASERKIEFIGDSITCGYGVDGVYGEDFYRTANEDCTKAYAYRTAELLDADYSIVAMSGYGIVSGYTATGEKVPEQIIPPYYTTYGRSYGSFAEAFAPEQLDWDFSEFVPDTIVVNLGTNDISYCKDDPDRRQEFIDGYKDFLRIIRENNPDAKIVCVLGIMGTDLCESMEIAAREYSEEQGDANIATMHFPVQNEEEDGVAVDWHPSETTHEKAANQLAEFLRYLSD